MKDHDCQDHRDDYSTGCADGITTGFVCLVCGVIHIEHIVVMNPEFYLTEPTGRIWGQQ